MTLYGLKPRFQAVLRPSVSALARAGVTANQVTLTAAAGSLLVGGFAAGSVLFGGFAGGSVLFGGFAGIGAGWPFLLIPAWLLVRMALNAMDGMLAREFDQKTPLGAYLNEIADVVSDAALYLPFALIAPFGAIWTGLVVLLAVVSEFAGALGPMIGASRRYDGPLGKSDRALVFGGLGLAGGLAPALPQALALAMPALAALLCLTILNRVRGGLREARERRQPAP